MEYLKTLQQVVCDVRPSYTAFSDSQMKGYGGGPLSSRTGTALVEAGVRLCQWYGGTEFGTPGKVFDLDESDNPSPDARVPLDWEWLSFTDSVDIRWVPQGDGTFELQFLVSRLALLHVSSVNLCGLDLQNPPPERGKHQRREGLCYQRLMETTPYQERPVENVGYFSILL